MRFASFCLLSLITMSTAMATPTFTPGPGVTVVGGEFKITIAEPGVGQPDNCSELATWKGTLTEINSITSAFDGGEVVGVDAMIGQIKTASGGLYSRKVGLCVGDEVAMNQPVVSGYICPAATTTHFDLTITH